MKKKNENKCLTIVYVSFPYKLLFVEQKQTIEAPTQNGINICVSLYTLGALHLVIHLIKYETGNKNYKRIKIILYGGRMHVRYTCVCVRVCVYVCIQSRVMQGTDLINLINMFTIIYKLA